MNAGETFCELEEVIDKLIDKHGFQAQDIMWNIWGHLKSHRPDCFPEYEDGKSELGFWCEPRQIE